MIGDINDFVGRMRQVLPRGWFADVAPVSDAVLGAVSAAWVFTFNLISTVQTLTRIRTSFGSFLDLISIDFFGAGLSRRAGESDGSYVARIEQELFRIRGTRLALTEIFYDLTGRYPVVIEPARPADTGGYSVGGVGYCVAGAWGDLTVTNCCFVTAFRPLGGGIADVAGFGTGGPLVYADLSMVASPVTDNDLFAAANAVLPLGCTVWIRLQD